MHDYVKNLAKVVRAAREEAHLSQAALAEQIGCDERTATDGLKKQKLLLMLQECNEQEAAEILPAIEYLLALIHKRSNSNE